MTWALIAANVIVFVADLVPQGGSINIMGGTGQLMPAGWLYARPSPTASGIAW